MTLTFREPKGAWDGVRVAIQMSLAHKALESWVLLEELCIDIACGLVHHVLFSDPEEGLGRVLWFPQRTAPVLVQPHCHRQWPVGGWSLRQVGSFVYRFLSAALSFLGPKVTADRTQRR